MDKIVSIILSEKFMLCHYQFIKSRSYESFRLYDTIHRMQNKDSSPNWDSMEKIILCINITNSDDDIRTIKYDIINN